MNDADVKLLRAAWVAPMTAAAQSVPAAGSVVRDAAVVFAADRVLAVGEYKSLHRSYPHAQIEDLGDVILLPGLVNPHTHLELSDIPQGERPAGFVEWLLRIIEHATTAARDSTSQQNAVVRGVEQCRRFGVTSVGDITSNPSLTRAMLSRLRFRATSYGEVRGMGQRRNQIDRHVESALQHKWLPPVLGGISPHAPYSCEMGGYHRSLIKCREHGLPLATHLAETPYEAEFLSNHSGPFRELWRRIGGWDDSVPKFDGGPIRFARELGLLDFPTLLAHVNYCDDDELSVLAAGRASIVYCPRTHAYFGHPPHRWREMLARGINVAVGTDSCASSPDLNLLDDLRLLHNLAPEIPAMQLWELATTRAAVAIRSDRAGRLAPGSFADAVAFAVRGDDPLTEILESKDTPARVWIDGRSISN